MFIRVKVALCILLLVCISNSVASGLAVSTGSTVMASENVVSFTIPDGGAVFEAENATLTPENGVFVQQNDITASCQQSVLFNQNNQDTIPLASQNAGLEFCFVPETEGIYYIWVRAFAANKGSDSVYVSLNGAEYEAIDTPEEPDNFEWFKICTTENIAAEAMFHVGFVSREPNFKMDQIIVTNNVAYVPFGIVGSEPLVPTPTPPPGHYKDIVTDFDAGIPDGFVPTNEVTVNSIETLNLAVASAQPGTVLYLADGVYNQGTVTINAQGTSEAPIIISAQNPGKAVFSGSVTFSLTDSDYVEVRDFYFDEMLYDVISDPSQNCDNFIVSGSSHCRITNNYFYKCGSIGDGTANDKTAYRTILSLSGKSQYNRVDHNTFEDSYSMGVAIKVNEGINLKNNYNKIDHNHFLNVKSVTQLRPGAVANGMESIQIGQGTTINKTNTLVEYNLFENVAGDRAEIISNKTDCNLYRYNSFIDCDSGFTLRQGSGCIVDSNYFYGDTKGIRVYGENHLITNNYLKDIKSRAIEIGNGSPIGPYMQVKSLTLANNTVIYPKAYGIMLDVGALGEGELAPESVLAYNNVVISRAGQAYVKTTSQNVDLKNNYVQLLPGTGDSYLAAGITSANLLYEANNGFWLPTTLSPIQGLTVEDVDQDITGALRGGTPTAGCIEIASSPPALLSADMVGTNWKKGISTKHYFSVESASGVVGDIVSVAVSISNVRDIKGVQGTVNYNPQVLELSTMDLNDDGRFDSVEPSAEGSFADTWAAYIFNETGHANFLGYSAESYSETDMQRPVVATLRFTVKAGATAGNYPITITNSKAAVEGGAAVLMQSPENGVITITDTSVMPPAVEADDVSNVIIGLNLDTMEYAISTDDGESFASYTSAEAPNLGGSKTVKVRLKAQGTVPASEDVLLTFTPNAGDVSGDGAIDISDVIMAAEIAVGYANYTEEQIQRANVSDKTDNTVDIADVILIAERVVGPKVLFPVEVQ